MHRRHKNFISLIKKWQAGNASKEELRVLLTYFFSHQKSEETLISETDKLETEQRMYKAILKDLHSTSEEKPVKNLRITPLIKFGIAAGIALLIALPFMLRQETSLTLPRQPEHSISFGTDKATLTLSNGNEIPLEKGKTFKNSFAESNGEELVYSDTEKVTSSKELIYNYLTIPRGGEFFLKLDDGTKVWLNSESKLKYPINFIKDQPRQVELVYGEAYFEVSPSTLHNGAKFTLNTGSQKIEVLGTEFNVKAYAEENEISTTLVNGKIAWNSDQQQHELSPSEQLNFNIESKEFKLAKVNVYNETSWKDRMFSFKEKSLADIAVVLSRWYDVDFSFENERTKSEKFDGVLSKSQSLENILNTIINTEIISDYVINNKHIILK